MILKFINTKGEEKQYNIANWTYTQLIKIKNLINKKDRDYVLIVDGEEGGGKSTIACQIAYCVDPTFEQSRMCLTPDEFVNAIIHAKPGQAVVFDEAFTGLASRHALGKINKLLVELMMEMRKKNLFVLICIPSIFYLEKYVALHRARGLIHTYFSNGKPGQYFVYNQKKLRQLYLFGKRKMSYSYPTIRIMKRFPNIQPIDWLKYEGRKIKALHKKGEPGMKAQKQIYQRNVLFKVLKEEKGMSVVDINLALERYNTKMDEKSIRNAINKVDTPHVE